MVVVVVVVVVAVITMNKNDPGLDLHGRVVVLPHDGLARLALLGREDALLLEDLLVII